VVEGGRHPSTQQVGGGFRGANRGISPGVCSLAPGFWRSRCCCSLGHVAGP
jgi:hypothetical protein